MKKYWLNRLIFSVCIGLVATVLLNLLPGQKTFHVAGPAFLWSVYFAFRWIKEMLKVNTSATFWTERIIPEPILEAIDNFRFRKYLISLSANDLTKSQRLAIVARSKSTMVIAGAGSGKTSVVVAKVQYLIEKKHAEAESILLLAFNKKAADEINERLALTGIPPLASTFHSFGYSLLSRQNNERIRFSEDWELEKFMNDCFHELSLNPDFRNRIDQHLTEFLIPVPALESITSFTEDAKRARMLPRTLAGERVKSYGEWLVANTLWKMGVGYKYEKPFKGGFRTDRHSPDFSIDDTNIYIEYFGIDGEGNTAIYIPRDEYLNIMQWKREVHQRNGTVLIELTYQDIIEGTLQEKLVSTLESFDIVLTPKSSSEIYAQAENQNYVSRATRVLTAFHNHFRSKRIDFNELRKRADGNERSIAFIDIYEQIHSRYLLDLDLDWDYSDLIHNAIARLQREKGVSKFCHILVDEYQDISDDRKLLVESILENSHKANLTVVGDDWQSIYRFTGSDLASMIGPKSLSSLSRRITLGETFRFGQNNADVSSEFVMRNPAQLRKKIISKAATASKVICHWNAMTSRNTENVIHVIGQIVEANLGIGSLLVLARYKNNLPDPVAIKKVWKSSEVTFSTIHSSKGLEADYVVVCDVYADSRGFPSIIEDDPVMNLVMDFATDFPNDEERRIFYVAITRARKECHLITPAESPSDFALELREFNGVEHRGIEEPVLCHKCLEGTLVMNTFLGSYCCTNYPLCTLRNPVCPICNEFGQLTELDPVHYSCKNHGDVFTSCPSCDFGTISRRYVGTTEFWNCHLWVETNCPGKY